MEPVPEGCEAPHGPSEETAGNVATSLRGLPSPVERVGPVVTPEATAESPPLELPPTVNGAALPTLRAPRAPAHPETVQEDKSPEDQDETGTE